MHPAVRRAAANAAVGLRTKPKARPVGWILDAPAMRRPQSLRRWRGWLCPVGRFDRREAGRSASRHERPTCGLPANRAGRFCRGQRRAARLEEVDRHGAGLIHGRGGMPGMRIVMRSVRLQPRTISAPPNVTQRLVNGQASVASFAGRETKTQTLQLRRWRNPSPWRVTSHPNHPIFAATSVASASFRSA